MLVDSTSKNWHSSRIIGPFRNHGFGFGFGLWLLAVVWNPERVYPKHAHCLNNRRGQASLMSRIQRRSRRFEKGHCHGNLPLHNMCLKILLYTCKLPYRHTFQKLPKHRSDILNKLVWSSGLYFLLRIIIYWRTMVFEKNWVWVRQVAPQPIVFLKYYA